MFLIEEHQCCLATAKQTGPGGRLLVRESCLLKRRLAKARGRRRKGRRRMVSLAAAGQGFNIAKSIFQEMMNWVLKTCTSVQCKRWTP